MPPVCALANPGQVQGKARAKQSSSQAGRAHLSEVVAHSSAAMWRSVAGCCLLWATKASTIFCGNSRRIGVTSGVTSEQTDVVSRLALAGCIPAVALAEPYGST